MLSNIVVPATHLVARLIGHAIEVKFCPNSLIFDLIANLLAMQSASQLDDVAMFIGKCTYCTQHALKAGPEPSRENLRRLQTQSVEPTLIQKPLAASHGRNRASHARLELDHHQACESRPSFQTRPAYQRRPASFTEISSVFLR